ncbi:helix-turn-helix domain-containing protein [Streptomyces uncialis]|uniref:DNA-binding protein n=1 Tax=Streptomyces uncialis TaxID=1048205 RepID=A0A1Q4V2H2_9ACTN|nr:helix-turn-helix transcriptional regulator [Streptomyces uncialis]OKH92033.1 DNA-binding protein [Streptomyces uncialis]
MSPRKRAKNTTSMKMLGQQLAGARVAAGYTQRTLAGEVGLDEETIASIEQGRRPLKPDIAELLDRTLDTKGLLFIGVDNLPEIDQFPMWAEQYMAHEREAVTLSWYDNQVLPGLLQTQKYANTVLRNRIPAYEESEIETKTAGRMERQQILHRKNPPTVSFVIWEPVLRLSLGDPAMHKGQLSHLLECSRLPTVALQFMPMDSPSHAGLDGPFIMLETSDHQHLAYAETQRGSQWISDPETVSILSRKYAMLRTQALSVERSRDLLDDLLGDQ